MKGRRVPCVCDARGCKDCPCSMAEGLDACWLCSKGYHHPTRLELVRARARLERRVQITEAVVRYGR